MIPVALDATNHGILLASCNEKWHKIGGTGKLSVSYQHMRRVCIILHVNIPYFRCPLFVYIPNIRIWYLCILFPFPLFFRTVRNLLKVMVLNTFDTIPTNSPVLIFTAPNTLTPFLVGYYSTIGSASSGGTRMASVVPCG